MGCSLMFHILNKIFNSLLEAHLQHLNSYNANQTIQKNMLFFLCVAIINDSQFTIVF
jgi:hypothetical protein